jgi:hypothetical protein
MGRRGVSIPSPAMTLSERPSELASTPVTRTLRRGTSGRLAAAGPEPALERGGRDAQVSTGPTQLNRGDRAVRGPAAHGPLGDAKSLGDLAGLQ